MIGPGRRGTSYLSNNSQRQSESDFQLFPWKLDHPPPGFLSLIIKISRKKASKLDTAPGYKIQWILTLFDTTKTAGFKSFGVTAANQGMSVPTHITKDYAIRENSSSLDQNI